MQVQHATARRDDVLASEMLRLENVPAKYHAPFVCMRRDAEQPCVYDLPARARDAVDLLLDSVYEQFVEPSLRLRTREEVLQFLCGHLQEFQETLNALHTFVARSLSEERARDAAERATEDAIRALARDVSKVAGPAAEEEVVFTSATYTRALRVIDRFASLPNPKNVDQDRLLCKRFHFGTALHFFGAFSLIGVTSEMTATPAAIDTAFELLRYGAFEAFAAAREALDLRSPPSPTEQLAGDVVDPFDVELADRNALDR